MQNRSRARARARSMLMHSSWRTLARSAGSNSMINPHAWMLSDPESIPSNGLKVMSTFSGGGGSSMGYKLAGCDVVAANDIDPEMRWHYATNLQPRHFLLCPVAD